MNKQTNDFDLIARVIKDLAVLELDDKFENLSPEEIKDSVDIVIRSGPEEKKVIFDLIKKLVLFTPKTSAPSFFNQLFGGRENIALIADMLVPLMNSSMYTFKVAGVQVVVEKEVIAQMLNKVGYEAGDGIFTPGGSISNLIAMLLARNKKSPSIVLKGFNGAQLVAYTSDQAHYSILKNARVIGIGSDNVREIKSDARGRLDCVALERAIKEDLASGKVPFFINATAGTTVLGAFDPIIEISKLAKRYGLWFHIDAALGGTVLLSESHKYLIAGSGLSDSFAWNAHKMMGVPLSASIILTKEKGVLLSCFNQKADYLFQDGKDEYNLGLKSLQCGRRNDAFKVWSLWKYLGHEGFEKRVNKQFDLAKYAKEKILSDGELELIMEPESINVCFCVKGKDSSKICDILDQKGMIKVSHGFFNDRNFIRLVTVNANLTKENIDNFFKKVKSASAELWPIKCVELSD